MNQQDIEVRPHQGLMKCGEILARHVGLGKLWGGCEEGLASLLSEALDNAGVPKSIAVTPRSVARSAGLVKRKKRRTK